MLNYEKLKNKAININSDINASKRKLRQSKNELEELEEKYKKLENNKNIQIQAIEMMKRIIEEMSREHIESMEELLTSALQTIFYDRNYKIKIEVDDRGNYKTAEFYLIEREGEDEIVTEFEESIGGGVRVVVGFVLQVFYIMYFDLKRIIWLDESFSQLSESYIEGLAEFIDRLADKRGFKIVLISHDKRINSYADRINRVSDGNVVIEKGGSNK